MKLFLDFVFFRIRIKRNAAVLLLAALLAVFTGGLAGSLPSSYEPRPPGLVQGFASGLADSLAGHLMGLTCWPCWPLTSSLAKPCRSSMSLDLAGFVADCHSLADSLAGHLGLRPRGFVGGLAAGLAFILWASTSTTIMLSEWRVLH
jgi:hypothetical protein